MKNSEQPINPLPSDVDSSKVECIGLTKREYFAVMAMQGLLSNDEHIKDDKSYPEITASIAIEYAEELLKQLES